MNKARGERGEFMTQGLFACEDHHAAELQMSKEFTALFKAKYPHLLKNLSAFRQLTLQEPCSSSSQISFFMAK